MCNPAKFLERIYGIRQNASKVEEPYETLEYSHPRSESLKEIFEYVYADKSVEVQAAMAKVSHNNSADEHFAELESIQYQSSIMSDWPNHGGDQYELPSAHEHLLDDE